MQWNALNFEDLTLLTTNKRNSSKNMTMWKENVLMVSVSVPIKVSKLLAKMNFISNIHTPLNV